MQSKSPKMAPSVRKWCPRAPKIEPKTTPGPLFSGFGDPLFSCNTTVVLLYFKGSRVPGTAQNEKKTRSLNSALQKVRKNAKNAPLVAKGVENDPKTGAETYTHRSLFRPRWPPWAPNGAQEVSGR